MKLLLALGCLFGVWVCHGLPHKEPALSNKAEECVMYRSKSPARPIMQFQRRISVAIMSQEPIPTAELILQSTKTSRVCQFYLMAGFITLACGKDNAVRENIESSDITELWMEVAGKTDDSASTTWDLQVMVRQGKHRTHILRHETGLQPPINMSVKSDQSIQYYFNCVTGCLFDKSMTMAPGDHKFFLRQDGDYVHMTIDGGGFQHTLGNLHVNRTVPVLRPPREGTDLNFSNLKPLIDSNAKDLPLSGSAADVSFGEKKFSINVTTDQLGLTRGLKEVTVVWDANLGTIGALVDGVPLFNHTLYTNLTKERQLTVTMGELSSGLVAPCNPNFQMVEFGGDEEVTKTRNDPSTTATSSEREYVPTADDVSQMPKPSQQASSGWHPAVFTFVVLNFIVTVVAVILAVLMYCRSSSNKCQLTTDTSAAPDIFSTRFSTRSSTRSTQRGSQRGKAQGDSTKRNKSDDRIKDGNVNSETVTTPLTTPDSLASPRKHRNLSTDEFVDLSLI